MKINKKKFLERLKIIYSTLFYLFLLMVLLAFILNKEETNKSVSQTITEKE